MERQNGYTLVEMTIAFVLTAMLAVAVHALVATGNETSRFVGAERKVVQGLRGASEHLARDLRQASTAKLTITTLPDQNHKVTLQSPLSLANGQIVWGVYDKSLGTDDASRSKPGWSVRYTVIPVIGGAQTDRQLRRQLVDASGKVVRDVTLMRNLKSGTDPQPGFQLTKSGAMYRVTLHGIADPAESDAARKSCFDVALRN